MSTTETKRVLDQVCRLIREERLERLNDARLYRDDARTLKDNGDRDGSRTYAAMAAMFDAEAARLRQLLITVEAIDATN